MGLLSHILTYWVSTKFLGSRDREESISAL
jgi:hypothetical protein